MNSSVHFLRFFTPIDKERKPDIMMRMNPMKRDYDFKRAANLRLANHLFH
jgi:hypothetical protein